VALLLLAAAALLATASSSRDDPQVSMMALHKFASTIDSPDVCKRGGFHWKGDSCSVCSTDFYFVDGRCAPRKQHALCCKVV
jgi:hypothetical protein